MNAIITTKPNPIVEPAMTPILLADDGGDGVGTEAPEGGNAGASIVGDDGLLTGDFVGDVVGDLAGEILGASFGDGGEDLGDGDEAGDLVGELTTGVVEGVDAGGGTGGAAADGGEAVAIVLTSSFIPEAQCPPVPHMKYLLPREDRVMTVIPPAFVDIAFVVSQES